MTIRFTKSWNGYYEGQIVSNPAGGNTEAQLIALGYAVSDLDGPDKSGDPVTVSADRTIAASDDGKVFSLTVAATLTIPANLSPRPSFIVNPPPTGNASIAVSGGANINGATTTLTRSRSSNPAGIAVVAYSESDGYGVGASAGGTWGSVTGTLSNQTDLASALAAKATSYAPVSLSANTTLTRAAHYNRLIVVDVSGGNVTLTATGTDALLGDFISVDVIGGGSNTVTLAGVTAQSGYQLTAVSGGNVEARCDVAASFIASTRTISAGAGATATLALVDGDFTSNNLNLTATHTNRVLDCTAVTIPVTLTIQTDASGGYDTTAAEIKVLGSTVAPIAIIEGSGATLVGKVQVIEQGAWGGARRKGVDSWAIVGQRNSGLSLGSSLPMFGISAPSAIGGTSVHSLGMSSPAAIDSSTTAAASTFTDGVPEYGTLRRLRYTGAAATNRSTGLQHSMSARMETVNSHFPMVFRFGIADALEDASKGPLMVGICSTAVFANTLGTGPIEPTATTIGVDFIVIGGETSDTNMQLMHRSNATAIAATKVDLGAAFPKSQFVAYELTLYKNNAGTAHMAVVKNMNTQAIAVKILTTNLPRTGRAYHTLFVRTSGTNATAAALDYIGTVVGAS